MRLPAILAVLLTLLPAAALGCEATGGRPGSSPASMVGTAWTCVEIEGVEVPAADAPTLRFDDDGRIGGSGGVNRYGAEIRRTGSSIEIAPIVSTKMAAEPARMELESRYFEALRSATRLVRSGGSLELFAGNRAVLRFAAAKDGHH